MDLTYSESEQAFRAEARDWLAANVPARRCVGRHRRTASPQHLEWERACSTRAGRSCRGRESYGGRDASLWEWLIFEEEYYRAGAPQRVTQNGIFLLAPTLFEFGTPEQQDRFLPRMAAARGAVVPGLVRAGRRQRPGGDRPAARCATRRPAAGG